MSLKTTLVVACLCVVTTVFLGCVDLLTESPEFPDFRTETRFIQADPALGSTQIMVDGSAVGTVDFQSATNYMDLPAGSRQMQVQGDPEPVSVALESDAKVTVVVFPRPGGEGARFRAFKERQTFASPPDTTGQVRFISAGVDTGGAGVTYDIVDASDSTVVASSLSFRSNSGYLNFPSGSHTFGVVLHDTQDILATADVTLSNGQRNTAVIFGDQTTLSFEAFLDD
ncbi:DUF4397 domain-containing protein [candidate division KSB1 bacterium]|nr:DUF4397 domain-containing protein [candidate division KSB1 bacterium]